MPISVHCPQCGKKLNAPDSAAGKRARCPQCKTILTLPTPEAPPLADEVLDAEPMQAPPDIGISAPGDAPGDEYGLAPDPNEQLVAPPPLPGGGLGGGGGAMEAGGPARRPCPMCGEMIPVTAVQCRFCHEIFDPAMKKAAMKKAKKDRVYSDADEDLSGGEWVVAILCSGIGCILGIIWMIQGKPKGKKMFAISFCVQLVLGVVRFLIEAASSHH